MTYVPRGQGAQANDPGVLMHCTSGLREQAWTFDDAHSSTSSVHAPLELSRCHPYTKTLPLNVSIMKKKIVSKN